MCRVVAPVPLLGYRLFEYRRPRGVRDLRGLGANALPHALTALEALDALRAHHLGEHDACRVDVGAGVYLEPSRLLGGHVGGGARHRARAAVLLAGETEVHEHHAARAREHDVLGLDVAVDQARPMNRLEAGEELGSDVLCFFELERTALMQHLEQGAAIHVLHGHQLAAVGLDEVEDAADVGGNHLTGGAHLVAQQVTVRLVPEEVLAHGLEGHLDTKLEIEGPPHLTHAAAAELGTDSIALTQHAARLQETPEQVLRGRAGHATFGLDRSVLRHHPP